MDTSKIGITTARAMDRIEKLVADGELDERAVVGAVVLVVAMNHPTPDDAEDRENLYDTSTATFVFGEPDTVYVQIGLLEMGKENVG